MTKVPCACLECGSAFAVSPSRVTDGRGKFCSKSCGGKAAARIATANRPSLSERFWSHVDRRGPDECWRWTASVCPKGYARLRHEGRKRAAHQISWEIANGRPFPTGLFGCHKCDNPSCVNPAHIFPGTHGDNMRDASAKGRWSSQLKPGGRCGRGHLLSPENLSRTKTRLRCKVCMRSYGKPKVGRLMAECGFERCRTAIPIGEMR
jgi:hypothetical protein